MYNAPLVTKSGRKIKKGFSTALGCHGGDKQRARLKILKMTK